MNIREALLASRETGRAVARIGMGRAKWIRWTADDFHYSLTAADLLAEDWTELEQ